MKRSTFYGGRGKSARGKLSQRRKHSKVGCKFRKEKSLIEKNDGGTFPDRTSRNAAGSFSWGGT